MSTGNPFVFVTCNSSNVPAREYLKTKLKAMLPANSTAIYGNQQASWIGGVQVFLVNNDAAETVLWQSMLQQYGMPAPILNATRQTVLYALAAWVQMFILAQKQSPTLALCMFAAIPGYLTRADIRVHVQSRVPLGTRLEIMP
jgi:hypothetical protein